MNCMRMSPALAPTAFRIPISRVRSVTDTSMMFMMPMPPTTSEMPAIAPRRIVSVRLTWFAVLRRSLWVWTVKSAVLLWRWTKNCVISDCVWLSLLLSVTLTMICWTLCVPLALRAKGVRAVSLTGLDGSLFQGKRKKKLVIVDERGRKLLIEGGYTGKVESVNSSLIETLMTGGYVPVVSPVAVGEDSEPLNIDGDRAAASLASGISADAVLFLTNVEGLMLEDKLVESISASSASSRLSEVGFGMQKKVMAAVDSVKAGVKEAIICSGTRDQPLSNALAHKGCTVIA
jgi:hypothetical protein